MKEPIWKRRAVISHNGDFICVETYSGYRMAMIDPHAPKLFLTSCSSNEVLGKAILEALSNSRFMPIEEAQKLGITVEENYKNWIEEMKSKYSYKTKTALFKKMMSCGIQLDGNIITIRPSNHEKLEGWSGEGIDEEDYVKIPADSPVEEIGAALRLAFKRCLGPKPDEYC